MGSEEVEILYGINVGRISIPNRREFLAIMGLGEDVSFISDSNLDLLELYKNPKEFGLDISKSTIHGPLRREGYRLDQIHVGERIKDFDFRPEKRGRGIIEDSEEAWVFDVNQIVRLYTDPSNLLKRLRLLGLKARKDDLALYAGVEYQFI